MAKRGRKPEVSDREILREFVVSPDPAFVASELGEKLNMSRQGVLNRLDDLEERHLLQSKKAAGRRIFWITHQGEVFFQESEVEDS
ncbi:helix-turn-helix domain-containing protein [Halalkaliarchaeum desulfuricum]|uniref:HTH domain-containing protein n=1 Tax=Halalkaliarchaeum desulfuricum TaxID=2055893 RepID=UPI00137B543D|nr:HTH domain-containing protein [Halalkaliarchaeum desulfuricum]